MFPCDGHAGSVRQEACPSSSLDPRHAPYDGSYPRFEGDIDDWEKPWLVLYPHLRTAGYLLRDRFNPEYFPHAPPFVAAPPRASSTGVPTNSIPWENRYSLHHRHIMDSTRAVDGLRVTIKAIDLSEGVRHHEWSIARIFAGHEVAMDPFNHCIRVIDYLRFPGTNLELLVMPQMLPFHVTPFETVGEVVHFLRQILEGLVFMHAHHVTHRDIGPRNIVMFAPDLFPFGTSQLCPGYDRDPLLTSARNSKYRPRREVYVRYYFIDFGLSWAFKSTSDRRALRIVEGQYKDAPEYAVGRSCDGFALDIWCVGRLIQGELSSRYRLPKSLVDFAAILMARDPVVRPTATAALAALDAQIAQMGQADLDRSLNGSWSKLFKSFRTTVGKDTWPPLTYALLAPPPLFIPSHELRSDS